MGKIQEYEYTPMQMAEKLLDLIEIFQTIQKISKMKKSM